MFKFTCHLFDSRSRAPHLGARPTETCAVVFSHSGWILSSVFKNKRLVVILLSGEEVNKAQADEKE